jgi:D-galactarolactone cycloisomerase
VAIYASAGSLDLAVPAALDDLAAYRDAGFGVSKVRVGCGRQDVGASLERATAIIAGCPHGLLPGVDAGQQTFHDQALWSRMDAQTLVEGLRGTGIRFLEDPLLISDLDGYRVLREMEAVPIAGGEMFHRVEPFRRYLAAGALDVAQPDACVVAGPGRMLAIDRLAQANQVEVILHSWAGPAATLQNLHSALAMEACDLMEYATRGRPLVEETIGALMQPANGRIPAPTVPGLGLSLGDTTRKVHAFRVVSTIIS